MVVDDFDDEKSDKDPNKYSYNNNTRQLRKRDVI